MMPIRRMKIKAAPNIMGGIGKKGNTTINSLNKDPFSPLSSIPKDSSSHKDAINISTGTSDNNKENFTLLKCDGGSPVSVIETVNNKENFTRMKCDGGSPVSVIETVNNKENFTLLKCDGGSPVSVIETVNNKENFTLLKCDGGSPVSVIETVNNKENFTLLKCDGGSPVSVIETGNNKENFTLLKCDGGSSVSVIETVNNKENFTLLKCDGGSPVSVIETVNNNKIVDSDFCEVIQSSDKCLLINSEKEAEDPTTTDSGSLAVTKQSNKLQLDLARRMKIKAAPNIGLTKVIGKKVIGSKSTGLNNNSALFSAPQESRKCKNGSLNRTISTLASCNSHDKEIVNVSNDEKLAISKESNLSSQREKENYNTLDKINLPVPELSSKLQEDLGIINSNLCLDSVPVSSSSVIDSGCEQGNNFHITRNKCTNPKKIPKPRKPVIHKKTVERSSLKEKCDPVDIEDSNDDSFSISSNFNSKLKSKKKCKENYFFKERKLQYKQKIKSTNGNLEVNEMPLFFLIFHNPSTNPMPQRRQERERQNSISSNAGSVSNEIRSRRNNKAIESDGITSETLEELRVEEEGLQIVNEQVSIHSPEIEAESNKNEVCIEDVNNEDNAPNVLAPQVKLGPDGNLIIDEKSLLIQTTAAKNRDKILRNSEVVEENENSSHYGKFSKRRKRATEWTKKETARFYKALATVGTDFSGMAAKVFAWRTRAELKIKFKKEERNNPHLVDIAMNDVTQFDFSQFDESDYDPDEDRKESKEAKKAEAKRLKDLEVQKRIEERNEERQKKKDQVYADKKRKKRLRELCNGRKKRKVEIPINTPEDSNESTAPSVVIEPQEVICEVVFTSRNSTVENQNENITISSSSLPHDVDAENEYTNTDKILKSSASSNKVASGDYLDILGIDAFEETNNYCSVIDPKELRDRDTLIVPIEDSLVDVMDVSSKTEAAIESAMTQIILPISSVKKNPDGSQYVEINTTKGLRKIEPVPDIPSGTSSIIVVFSQDASESGEQVFHVYFVSPVASNLEEMEPCSKDTTLL